MTTSERREEIARTLFLSDYDEFTPDKIDASSTWLTLRESYLTNADALLARFPVLAGVTDEMVETAARALNRNGWTCDGGSDEPGRYDECEYCRRACAGTVRAVLSAVLGPRDADAPGGGGES